MKRFLKPKLIFTLVTVILLASAIAIPLIPGATGRSHAANSAQVVQPVANYLPDIKAQGQWFQLSHFGSQLPAADARIKALTQAKSIRLSKSAASTTWSPLGPQPINSNQTPGLVSGRITAEAVNPTNSNDIWVGAADGGLWHSTDGGAHWSSVTDSQPTLSVGAIAIDPTNASIIYVGTGEANSNGDAYWGVGVLKSTDSGATWTNYGLSDFGGLGIGKIAIDPANSQIVLLSAVIDAFPGPPSGPANIATEMGIWRSTDGGSSWTHVLTGASPSTPGTDVVFDPAKPSIVFAGLGGNSSASGVYKSTNSGQTWTRISSGIPTGTGIERVSLGISSSGAHVYAVLTNAKGDLLKSSIYVSTNTGTKWAAKNVSTVPGMVNDDSLHQWWYDSYVAVAPGVSTGNTAEVGGVDIWQTTNGGTSWTNLTNATAKGPVHSDQHALVYFSKTSSSFYIGNDGGVWSGNTSGAFTNLNSGGLNITQFYGGSIGEVGTNAQLYGGAQDNGEDQYPVGSPSSPAQWNERFGGDGGYTVVDYTNNAIVYEEYVRGAISKSSDGANTWSAATSGINSGDPVNFIMPFIMSPNNNNELLAGTDRIYKTTNGAANWNAISGSLDSGKPISAIAVAPGNDSYIYAGDDAGHVYVTTNGGSVWSGGAVPGSTGGMVRGIAVDPNNPSTVYVSFANFAATGTGQHVFKSTDAGSHWTDISSTLPNIPFSSILVINSQIVVGSDVGVFSSSDGGSHWSQLGSGLPNVAIDQVFANHSGTKLFLATHGRGIWTLPLASGGNLWVTGHDPDYHCTFDAAQCNYLKVAVNFVMNGSTLPVLALDHGTEVATAVNAAFSGSGPSVTTVDPRTGFSTLPLVSTSGTPLYSAIIVASDTTCGGCDNNDGVGITPDSDAINARAADIAQFYNAGGGILALAGAENIGVFYNFMPVATTGATTTSPYTFTSLGLSLGLIEGSDDNCCATHNSFQTPASGSPFQIAETDSAGLPETMIVQNGTAIAWARPARPGPHQHPTGPRNPGH